MPTGYTNEIYDGEKVSGKDFILKCARNFGVLISMRDLPLDATIPKFEVRDHYEDDIVRAKERLNKYTSMSLEEAEKMAEENYQSEVARRAKAIEERNVLKERYMKVHSEVLAWKPPTEELMKLKLFALNQINISIEADCDTSCYERPVKKSSGEELLSSMIDVYTREVAMHEQNLENEKKHVASKNKWVEDLRNSLK